MQGVEGLASKLQDLAMLLRDYLDWLARHQLRDGDCLLAAAVEALAENSKRSATGPGTLSLAGVWVDGFAELSQQELEMLAALLPHCDAATVTFCLERVPTEKLSWLSGWSVVRKTFEECRKRLESVPGVSVAVEVLARQAEKGRFAQNPVLQHLERFWGEPQPYAPSKDAGGKNRRTLNIEPRTLNLERDKERVGGVLRVEACVDPEGEATLAAREILRHVRAGGRFREVSVLVRSLAGYNAPLQRVFSRYEIPFFLDRREPVTHHPLAELTRSALRAVALGWQHEDWFAALKTGLAPATDEEIDQLENEALARGWQGAAWQQPLRLHDEPRSPEDEARLRQLESRLEQLRLRLVPPFHKLALALAVGSRQSAPTGPQLAAALREFWQRLNVEAQLEQWAAGESTGTEARPPNSVHATVWEQMNGWLANVELAFPDDALAVREWLPILEAGLANLSVGVIPPALDQVLIGTIDRSRNPEIKLALVLGLNETVFPAPPQANVLLTEADRCELERRSIAMGSTAREQLGRERFYAYIACTRARERLVLTSAVQDAEGSPLNPSPFLSHLRQLFPSLEFESVAQRLDWRESEHAAELIGPLLKMRSADGGVRNGKSDEWRVTSGANGLGAAQQGTGWEGIAALPGLANVLEQLRHFQSPGLEEAVAPELAARLYGPVLRTSVSRMEQFAACPFKFFVHSGLRAQERQLYELDYREQGSFQHDVLALFHQELKAEHKRWRDLTRAQARERIARLARGLMVSYRDGLLQASDKSRFMARVLTESLQDFVETLVDWMREQYLFEPMEVELPFGEDENSPAWALSLPEDRRLELWGRIDRVDLYREPGAQEALCVVVDYKSGQKQLDPVLLAHGVQLQLLAYLNVLRRWPHPRARFGVERLVPAGVFYVGLRGQYGREQNRSDALADAEDARKLAYRHTGRFDFGALRQLDSRSDAQVGDQFNYRLNKDGQLDKRCREALSAAQFETLLDSIEANLLRMGQEVFGGRADVAPYRKGKLTACDQCDYQSICRIDPWTHQFRVLRPPEQEPET